jgi:hypothetical protein
MTLTVAMLAASVAALQGATTPQAGASQVRPVTESVVVTGIAAPVSTDAVGRQAYRNR